MHRNLCASGSLGGVARFLGWHVNTVMPLTHQPEAMLSAAGTENYNTLLSTQKGLKAVTQWLISQNVLDQFRVAKEMVMEGKGASDRRPLMTLQ